MTLCCNGHSCMVGMGPPKVIAHHYNASLHGKPNRINPHKTVPKSSQTSTQLPCLLNWLPSNVIQVPVVSIMLTLLHHRFTRSRNENGITGLGWCSMSQQAFTLALWHHSPCKIKPRFFIMQFFLLITKQNKTQGAMISASSCKISFHIFFITIWA